MKKEYGCKCLECDKYMEDDSTYFKNVLNKSKNYSYQIVKDTYDELVNSNKIDNILVEKY